MSVYDAARAHAIAIAQHEQHETYREADTPNELPSLPGFDGIPRDPVDLNEYVPAYANPGYLINGMKMWSSCTSWCRECDTHWAGNEPCWVCGNDPQRQRWALV